MFEQYSQPDPYRFGTPHWTPSTSLAKPSPEVLLDQPIFVGHGRREVPLRQLLEMLQRAGVRYALARDEPNQGRMVLEKVLDTMQSCRSGIFLFTDDGYRNPKGEASPNPNVMGELGTAIKQYPKSKIIIMKEDVISLPSNYSGLVFIEFTGDNVWGSADELYRELNASYAARSHQPKRRQRGPTRPLPEGAVSPTQKHGPL